MNAFGGQFLDAPMRWVPELGYLLKSDAKRKEALEHDLDANSICSQQIKKVPLAAKRKWLLCFISFDNGWLTHLARGEVRYPAQSGWDRLDLWNMVKLEKPLRLSALARKFGTRSSRARSALKDGGHLPAKAFDQVLEALKQTDADAYQLANSLIDSSPPPRLPESTIAQMNWAYQRDAAATALEIAGIPLEMLKVSPQIGADEPSSIASIFDDVGDMRAIEDVLVLRDLDGDPDWGTAKKHRYPARTFESGDTKLTIILANKLELEKQLGVDLIYVNETAKAVVFVQYKMFKGVKGEDGYRPDDQLEEEIRRMDAAIAKLASLAVDESCDGYRFSNDPFFLKFCIKLLEHDQQGHVPGYYLPISYRKRLACDPRVKGTRKGILVKPSNLGRHFTPTAFKDLVTRGWIGTSVLGYEVVIPFLKSAMAGERSIVFAVQSKIVEDEIEEPKPRLKVPRPIRRPGQKAPTIQI